MLASERRELLLKALHGAFPGKEFCVKDIQERLRSYPDLLVALDTEFGHGFFKTKKNLHPIKIGRLLQGKLIGKRFGDLELVAVRVYMGVNYYRIRRGNEPVPIKAAPAPAAPRPILTISRVDPCDGRIHTETLRDRNGEPLQDKSADAPVVDKPEEVSTVSSGPVDNRPPWTQRGESQARNKAEWLAWQHSRTHGGTVFVQPNGLADSGYYAPIGAGSSMLPLPGMSGPNGIRAPAHEVSTLWNRTLRDL